MREFGKAAEAVDRALATGQIGVPVAVRIVASQTADHGRLERAAARALTAAERWLGAEVESVWTSENALRGQVTVLARCGGGKSTLVSAGLRGEGRPTLVITVWGNRGTVSWEDGAQGITATGDDGANADANDERSTNRLRQLTKIISAAPRAMLDTESARIGNAQNEQDGGPPKIRSAKSPFGLLLVAGDHTHQPNYVADFLADGRCKIVGVTDEPDVDERRRKLNAQLAKRLGVPVLDDLNAALRRDDVRIVSICAEPFRRGRIAVQAAEAGKHLYLDKPLAGSIEDAEAITAAVRKAGVVGHMFSMVQMEMGARVRNAIRSGRLGDVSALHFDLCFAKGYAGTADLSRVRHETVEPERFELLDAKRELTNVGVYPVVMLRWLLGRAVRTVSATTGNYFFREHQGRDFEDFGQMLLTLEGDVTATVSAGRTGWQSHPGVFFHRVTLIGTKGTQVIDADRPRVSVWADVKDWQPPKRDPEDPMAMWGGGPKAAEFTSAPKRAWLTPAGATTAADVTHFLDCVEQGRASDVSADDAAEATKVLMAAYRSAATGETTVL